MHAKNETEFYETLDMHDERGVLFRCILCERVSR